MAQGATRVAEHSRLAGSVSRGDHVCLFYDDPTEQIPALLPFIQDALYSGERFVYVADDLAVDEVATALAGRGIDVQHERERGALVIWDRHDWRAPGQLDMAAKSAHVRQVVEDAVAAGFNGVAFAIEMTWTLGPDIEADPLGAWEATLDSMFGAALPMRMTCQYSRARLAPGVIRAALMTHPIALLDGYVSTNPYYVEPAQWISGRAPSETVPADHRADWMLSRIRSTRLLASEREERLRAQAALTAAEAAREQVAAEAELFATLHRVGQIVLSELDEQKAVQAVTELIVPAVGARFGAFFHNATNEAGEHLLYTLAGVDRAAFEDFPMPRVTELFGPTFRGEGTVRIDDVRAGPRYEKGAPDHGLSAGHQPVRSYLAVPVVGRSGEVMGGLFFGHEQPGVFSERDARLAEGVAAQAAIAIENGRLYAEAQRALTAREQFLGVASHELKTPLTVLKGYSLLLDRKIQRQTLDAAELPAIAGQLVTHSRRLEALVNDLLETSRIQRGRLDLRLEHADLATLTREVVERIAQGVDRHEGHEFVVDADAPGLVWSDPSRIDQVLTNLVDNAVKYSPDGGAVRVTFRAAGDWAEVAVEDEGIGIPMEAQASLFEPFYRVHTEGDPFGGTGLGLYISAQIVEAHGGTIAVDSRPGAGSTFTVRLPLRSSSAS